MNAGIKARWVAALRSGQFPQTQGALNRISPFADQPAGFCCLGVLCEIAVEDGVLKKAPADSYVAEYFSEFDESIGFLPESVMEWSEIILDPESTGGGYDLVWEDVKPFLTDYLLRKIEPAVQHQATVNLVLLNDYGVPFETIADIVEALY